jgi:hypothetical protein
MKLRINSDGSMEFDVDSLVDAVALAQAARGTAPVQQQIIEQESDRPTQLGNNFTRSHPGAADMNDVSYKTWVFLVDNDNEVGVHLSAVGRHFGITPSAAQARCTKLMHLGHAKRVRTGYYRALS